MKLGRTDEWNTAYNNRDDNHPNGRKCTIVLTATALICECYGTKKEQNENARLISCAPELAEALRECRIALRFYREYMHKTTAKTSDQEPGTNYPYGDQCESNARALLARIDGE